MVLHEAEASGLFTFRWEYHGRGPLDVWSRKYPRRMLPLDDASVFGETWHRTCKQCGHVYPSAAALQLARDQQLPPLTKEDMT